MTSEEAGMELTAGSVAGLVVAGLLALLFLVSCILSLAKAVRDRRQIKARIAAKRAGQLNGHAPRANKPSLDEGRRGRPNILLVHDNEREERVKRGTNLPHSASSPRFPSGVSSPEDQNSRRTESTTVAEVACHHSSLATSPGDDDVSEGAESGIEAVHHESCSLPGQIRYMDDCDSELNTSVDISGQVIEYRRSSVVNCNPNSVAAGYSSSSSPYGNAERKRSKDSGTGNKVYGEAPGTDSPRRDISPSSVKHGVDNNMTSDREETSERVHSSRDKSSPSRGFAKKKKVSSHHVAYGAASDVVCVSYNPRRNSYAAAIASDPDWLERATARRHSDEPRHHASSSSTRKDNMRMRNQCRQGADNPAYNAADDKITI